MTGQLISLGDFIVLGRLIPASLSSHNWFLGTLRSSVLSRYRLPSRGTVNFCSIASYPAYTLKERLGTNTVFRSVSFSTGVTYLDNQNIAKQVGFKQNIQFMLQKHFDVSAFVDLRRNLIKPLYPDLFSTGRAEFSIHYYLDRQ